jgi:mannosyltransferase OCH1-like enzyme
MQSIADNPNSLKTQNPDWTYTIYDDDDILDLVRDEYGSSILSTYLNVSPLYGAARADLFRYLLMYKMGGIYLDIKSTSIRPFSDALTLDEGFVLSHWRNGPGQEFQGSGIHPELAALPGGEFQQWFIICKPSHPYLAAVIERVLENIARYRPWRGGVALAFCVSLARSLIRSRSNPLKICTSMSSCNPMMRSGWRTMP